MNPVFTALVPALQISWGGWWDSNSGGSYGGSYDDWEQSWT